MVFADGSASGEGEISGDERLPSPPRAPSAPLPHAAHPHHGPHAAHAAATAAVFVSTHFVLYTLH